MHHMTVRCVEVTPLQHSAWGLDNVEVTSKLKLSEMLASLKIKSPGDQNTDLFEMLQAKGQTFDKHLVSVLH